MNIRTTLLIVVVGIFTAIYYGSVSNTEVSLRQHVLSQNKLCKSKYDNMWKTISQKAKVSKEHSKAFKEIYTGIMENRYKNDSEVMMKFIEETNPNFDQSLFKELMRTIDVKRNEYYEQEKRLIDLKREHDTYLLRFPQNLMLGSRQPIDIKTVTSSRTEGAFETGRDDNIDLFQ